MSVNLDPYIFFNGNANEALEFYKSIFGGKLDISTFASMKDKMPPEYQMDDDKIMHGLLSGGAVRLMVSDSVSASPEAKKIELSLNGEDEAMLKGFFEKLSEGGKVTMPLEKAPWGDYFGMVTDKYNVAWMVNVTSAENVAKA